MEINLIQPIINSVIDANKLIKRHAEERLNVLSDLFSELDVLINQDENSINLIETTFQEIHDIHESVNSTADTKLDLELIAVQEKKLKSINKIIGELDVLEENKEYLEKSIEAVDKSIEDRDELISILSEYVELETASNYKILAEIAELENIQYNFEKSMNMYSMLSRYDPRIQTINILEKYQNGISKYQLIKMLDISDYEAIKIIDELIALKMIETRGSNTILHLPGEKVDLGYIKSI